ncbi:hypothetical protein GCM10027597_32220 [Saccharopolyspora tripterygii]
MGIVLAARIEGFEDIVDLGQVDRGPGRGEDGEIQAFFMAHRGGGQRDALGCVPGWARFGSGYVVLGEGVDAGRGRPVHHSWISEIEPGQGGSPADVQAVTEGDGEGVEDWLPTHRPSGVAGSGGVQAAGHKIQAFQRCLFVGEMSSRADRSAIASVE